MRGANESLKLSDLRGDCVKSTNGQAFSVEEIRTHPAKAAVRSAQAAAAWAAALFQYQGRSSSRREAG